MRNSESPAQQIKRRFKKNKLAMAGWYVIILSFFVAVFAYVIIPDQTPLSNRMNLSLGNKPPGFNVEVLKIPRSYVEKTGFFDRVFNGKKDAFDFLPVSAHRVNADTLYYKEFTGDIDENEIPESKIAISQLRKNGDANGEISPTDFFEKRVFIFGSDRYGRDMLSRIIAGTRITLSVGFVAVVISLIIGLFFGSLAGFFRGKVDGFIVWLINVIWSVPTLLLVITITLVLGKGFSQVFIAVGLTMWVDVARIVRSQLFSVRELEFVSAGRAMGFRNLRIIGMHMLPNVIGPVLVVAASNFSTAILLEAGLSFLGIGAQPPTPSWGSMIKENYGYIIVPGSAYLAILPGLAIMIMTMAFTFVANGLRDAIDSKAQVSLV